MEYKYQKSLRSIITESIESFKPDSTPLSDTSDTALNICAYPLGFLKGVIVYYNQRRSHGDMGSPVKLK